MDASFPGGLIGLLDDGIVKQGGRGTKASRRPARREIADQPARISHGRPRGGVSPGCNPAAKVEDLELRINDLIGQLGIPPNPAVLAGRNPARARICGCRLAWPQFQDMIARVTHQEHRGVQWKA
jgi:hypothetical protein